LFSQLREPIAHFGILGHRRQLRTLDRSSSIRTGFRRSGADIILTYWAQQAAKWLKD
jgi:delta-aminolevulinic acid dehydratase/porphobilinogen synthase